MREDDFGPQDTGDINIFDRNTSLPIAFRLGTTVRQTVTGSDRLSGRLSIDNGDKARVTYRISSFDVDPPPPPVPPPPPFEPPPPPPPGPSGDADLIVTHPEHRRGHGQEPGHRRRWFVLHQGLQRGRCPGYGSWSSGLAAGASVLLIPYTSGNCEGNWLPVADYTNVVPESNEGNNTRVNLDETPIC